MNVICIFEACQVFLKAVVFRISATKVRLEILHFEHPRKIYIEPQDNSMRNEATRIVNPNLKICENFSQVISKRSLSKLKAFSRALNLF